jgi:hypothetical protein
MLTIFTIPKPFAGHIGVIQRNAIMSWLHLVPGCEIILFGDEPGIEEIAKEFNLIHIPEIRKSRYGTPFLNDVFFQAQQIAHNEVMCYCNTDIIFFNAIIDAVKKIPLKEYLMVGDRWDVDITTPLDTSQEKWAEDLFNYAKEHHTLLDFMGMDYFIFPKGMLLNMLPFIVGRRGWDNWLIFHVRQRKISVIDATPVVHVVHQNHDYSHIPDKKGTRWDGPESSENLNLLQNRQIYLWELTDSDWVLTPAGLGKKQLSLRTVGQVLVLSTPQKFQIILEPFFRVGHLLKYGYLKLSSHLRR